MDFALRKEHFVHISKQTYHLGSVGRGAGGYACQSANWDVAAVWSLQHQIFFFLYIIMIYR